MLDMQTEDLVEVIDEVAEEEKGSLISDLFAIFFSDHDVIVVLISSIAIVTLLIIATDIARGRR